MNYFDIILIIPLLWGVYVGYTKGLVLNVASLLALLLGIWGACIFSKQVADSLMQHTGADERYMPVIAFIITFLLVVIGVHLLAKLLNKLIKAIALSFVNRMLGVVFSVGKNALFLSVFLLILNFIDARFPFISPKMKQQSLLYNPLSKIVPTIYPYLNFQEIELPEISVPELPTPFHQKDSVNQEGVQV